MQVPQPQPKPCPATSLWTLSLGSYCSRYISDPAAAPPWYSTLGPPNGRCSTPWALCGVRCAVCGGCGCGYGVCGVRCAVCSVRCGCGCAKYVCSSSPPTAHRPLPRACRVCCFSSRQSCRSCEWGVEIPWGLQPSRFADAMLVLVCGAVVCGCSYW